MGAVSANIFDVLIECPQVGELIEGKYLVPSIVYATTTPDFRGVPNPGPATTSKASSLSAWTGPNSSATSLLTGNATASAAGLSSSPRTLPISVHLRDEFVKSGFRAEHLDGSTPTEDRDAILKRLAYGDTEVVCNCAVLTEGVDIPDVACIILAALRRAWACSAR